MRIINLVSFAFILVLICGFLFVVVANSVNIPVGDDFYCLLLFAQKFHDSDSILKCWSLLTEQWVEHRILFSRSTALISLFLNGEVNFVTVILIGNLTLIAFTILFGFFLKKFGAFSWFALLPIVLILFNPSAYEGNVWPGAATVYMPVSFLGLLTIYLISQKSTAAFIFAAVTASIATFSFGNGMFAFLAALVVLLYSKEFRKAGVWMLISIGMVFAYFVGYGVNSATKSFDLFVHFQYPLYIAYNLFVFIGGIASHIDNTNGPFQQENIPAFIVGIILFFTVLTSIFLFLFQKPLNTESNGIRKSKVVWLGMVLFIMLTTLAMTYSRTFGESMNTVSSRYRVYSMLFFVFAYLGSLILFKNRNRVTILYSLFAFAFLVFNYFIYYEKLANFKSSYLAGSYNYEANHDWVIYRHTAYYAPASRAVSDTIKSSADPVYHFKKQFPELTIDAIAGAKTLGDVLAMPSSGCYGKPGKCLFMTSNTFPSTPNLHKGIYLVLYNQKNIYLYPCDPLKNGKANMLTSFRYFKNGFSVLVDYDFILPDDGGYQLAVFCPSEKSDPIRKINYPL